MRHTPVLLKEIMEGLNLRRELEAKADATKGVQSGDSPVYIDCNLGDGGHAEAFIRAQKGDIHVIGFDLDQEAIERAEANIAKAVKKEEIEFNAKKNLHLFRKNFRTLEKTLTDADMTPTGEKFADAILFDLGLSSFEIDESGRGFSFRKDEPLSMTFGKKSSESGDGTDGDHAFDASDIVNTWKEEDIANVIFAYGEDKFARRIAKRIVEARGTAWGENQLPIRTTAQLADIVKAAYPGKAKFGKIHPATRTFQALRIAVNDELRALEAALPQAFRLLKPGGRLAVISFHSLEDRIVKHFFKEVGGGEILTKRPITPTAAESKDNQRARSAKLRIIQKI